MKLRLMGLPDEVQAVARALSESPVLTVVSVSSPYANRGDSAEVRVYVEVRLVEASAKENAR